jgi:hypothetical protein
MPTIAASPGDMFSEVSDLLIREILAEKVRAAGIELEPGEHPGHKFAALQLQAKIDAAVHPLIDSASTDTKENL